MRRAVSALALSLMLAGAPVTGQGSPPDEAQVLAGTDAGLALLLAGDRDGAFRMLDALNETVQEGGYGPVARSYPNMALAHVFLDAGDPAQALRFANAAVAGFTAFDHADHPGRILATVAQGAALERLGRLEQAEITLRAAVATTRDRPALAPFHGMALFHLARAVTLLDGADQSEIRRDFLGRFTPDWHLPRRDAVHIQYYDLEYAERHRAPVAELIDRSEALLRTAKPIADLPPGQLAYYYGFHGYILAQAQRYRDARPYLVHLYRHHRDAGLNGPDVWRTTRHLANVLFRTDGPDSAYGFLQKEIAYAREVQAASPDIAPLIRDLGHIARNAGDAQAAQGHYRAAYAEARGKLPVTDVMVRDLRRLIDPEAPGFDDFTFAEEIRNIAGESFAFLPDASGTLAAFLSQGFAGTRPHVIGTDPDRTGDPAVFLINRALYHALVGLPDAMLADLTAAHEAAQTGQSQLSPDATIFDFINAIAYVWGTEHEPARAFRSLEALYKRYDSLNDTERLLFHALGGYTGSQLANMALMSREVTAWMNHPAALAPQGAWQIFANTLGLEMAYGNVPAGRTEAIHAALQEALGPPPGNRLVRALVDMGWTVLADPDGRSEAALARRALLEKALADSLPPGHNILSAAQFGMATAYHNRGDMAESALWMGKAIKTLRNSDHHRPDRLAYLMARHARTLSAMGDVNGGAALAAEALAMVDPETASGTYLGEVLISHALAFYDRTRDIGRTVAFFDDWLARPGLLGRLRPQDRVELLYLAAAATARTTDVNKGLAAFARARDAMKAEHQDWRLKRARLEFDQAKMRYHAGQLEEAFADATLSNDLYLDWAADSAVTAEADPKTFRDRAAWEVGIGWALAQSLP